MLEIDYFVRDQPPARLAGFQPILHLALTTSRLSILIPPAVHRESTQQGAFPDRESKEPAAMASIFGLRGWMVQSPGTGLYRSARRRVGPEPATFRFRTGGHYRGSDAVLMIEVIGLNGFFEPENQVNGQAVGHLRPNRGANENWMWTQMVVFRADILESG